MKHSSSSRSHCELFCLDLGCVGIKQVTLFHVFFFFKETLFIKKLDFLVHYIIIRADLTHIISHTRGCVVIYFGVRNNQHFKYTGSV